MYARDVCIFTYVTCAYIIFTYVTCDERKRRFVQDAREQENQPVLTKRKQRHLFPPAPLHVSQSLSYKNNKKITATIKKGGPQNMRLQCSLKKQGSGCHRLCVVCHPFIFPQAPCCLSLLYFCASTPSATLPITTLLYICASTLSATLPITTQLYFCASTPSATLPITTLLYICASTFATQPLSYKRRPFPASAFYKTQPATQCLLQGTASNTMSPTRHSQQHNVSLLQGTASNTMSPTRHSQQHNVSYKAQPATQCLLQGTASNTVYPTRHSQQHI